MSSKYMKIDPYKHKERYLAWKKSVKKGISDISKENSDTIIKYITDMEHGLNVSALNRKGPRSYIRLNTIREKMNFFVKRFKEEYDLDDITKLNEEQVVLFFSKMKSGKIKRKDGKAYKSLSDFVKCFKAFWHWHMKVNRKNGNGGISDITTDLDIRGEKPDWVYLTEKQVKSLCDNSKHKYKVLIMFLYDTGIRSPTELINIRVSDLYGDFKELHIRDEISKTFGRKIKLMLCSELIKEHVTENDLKPHDQLFPICPKVVNQYLKALAKRVLGDKRSLAGKKYTEITMYDFRHCACCYWLPRYKSESALKYRFGWKGSDKIHYYSELLGMKDTISEEDLLVDVTKTEIEKRLEKSENQKEMLMDRVKLMEDQMKKILSSIDAMDQRVVV